MESIEGYRALIESREIWGTLTYDFLLDSGKVDKEFHATDSLFSD